MSNNHHDRTPPAGADDHVLAEWLATVAGERLLEVRAEGLEGRELKDAGDQAAHEVLMKLLAAHRPDDSVLSEEGKDDKARLQADRVWIVDPLDGTREFSEPPRDDWAVHVALWENGELVAGAVAQPALGETFSTAAPPVVPDRTSERPRIAVSRTRPPAFVEALAAELDAELVPMGSAGVKVISVVRDISDAYVHAGGQYEWDNAAPVAVARAAGLFCSRIDGADLKYNQDDVSLPDLIVCRPELVRGHPRLRPPARNRLGRSVPLRASSRSSRFLREPCDAPACQEGVVRSGYAAEIQGVFRSKPTYHLVCSTILTNVEQRMTDKGRRRAMWDTVIEQKTRHLSHEMPCTACGHAPHSFLPCSDTCDCTPPSVPGAASGRQVDLVLH